MESQLVAACHSAADFPAVRDAGECPRTDEESTYAEATRAVVEVCSLPAPEGYDPWLFVRTKYPDLHLGAYPAGQIEWISRVYDPSRIQIAVRLVPYDFFNLYMDAAEDAAALASMSPGGTAMLKDPLAT